MSLAKRIFCLILVAGFMPLHSASEKRIREQVRKLYYGSPEEQMSAVRRIGAERIGAGLRPILDLLKRRENGVLTLQPRLIASMCNSLGKLGHPMANETLVQLVKSSRQTIQFKKDQDKAAPGTDPGFYNIKVPFGTHFKTMEFSREAQSEFLIGISAIAALGQLDLPEGRQVLLEMASNKEEFIEFRVAAVKALRRARSGNLDEVVDKLRSIIKEENEMLQANAAFAILALRGADSEASQKIKQLLKTSRNYEVRRDVGWALQEVTNQQFIEPLEAAIAIEDDPGIRMIFKDALERAKRDTGCCYQP